MFINCLKLVARGRIMRTLIFGAIFSCYAAAGLRAAPVRLPSATGIRDDQSRRFHFDEPLPNPWNREQILLSFEIEAESLSERRLKAREDSSARSIKAQFISVRAAFSPVEYIDFYLEGGAAEGLRLHSDEAFYTTTLKLDTGFVYGGGLTLSFCRWGNGWCFFGDGRVRAMSEPNPTWQTFSPPPFAGSTTSLLSATQTSFRYAERQCALGIGKTISVADSQTVTDICLAAGGVYSDVAVRARGRLIFQEEWNVYALEWINDYDYGSMSSRKKIGAFVDLAILSTELTRSYARHASSTFVTTQIRVGDELAGSLRAGVRF